MKKPHMNLKRTLAVLIALLCVVFSLIGCKIEMPSDEAEPSASPAVTQEAKETHNHAPAADGNQTSNGNVEEESNQSQMPSETSDGDKQSQGSKPDKENESSSKAPSSSKTTSSSKPAPKKTNAPSKTTEPQKTKAPDDSQEKTLKCTMTISCKTILNNLDQFDQNKMGILPKNGTIYSTRTVTFTEGETVFDILARETKKNRIHMEHQGNPMYNSEYIEGIGNIYEKDCGEGSGWMYKVNGKFPNYGCSLYKVKAGDKIEWLYTCDLGHDLGRGY